MDSWQKYLNQVISLHARAKNLESSLKLEKILSRDVLPSKLIEFQDIAEQSKKLYTKAYRMCQLLKDTQDEDSTADLDRVSKMILKDLNRMNEMIKIIDSRAAKFGIREDEEFESAPQAIPYMESSSPDLNSADDAVDYDIGHVEILRADVRNILKRLRETVSYMDVPELRKIRIYLDRLINY